MDTAKEPPKRKGIARVTYVGDNKHESFSEHDVRIEERLQLHHLQQLMFWFQSHEPPPVDLFTNGDGKYEFFVPVPINKNNLRKPGLLTPEEFKDTLAKVLGTRTYDNQLDSLFTKLDTSSDGYVDWNEFCTYMLLQFREKDYMRTKLVLPFQSEAKIRHILQNKQETTTKILSIDSPTKIITFSKEGSMCVWTARLHLEKSYNLNDTEGRSGNQRGSKRRVREWITDAVYMANCHRLAIGSTGRDIRFYDTTTANLYYEEFCLYAMPDAPTCLTYWYDVQSPGNQSVLLYGDDHGSIHLVYFHRPLRQMFAIPFQQEEGVQRIYFPDLHSHSEWVSHVKLEYSYVEPIRKVLYLPDNNYIAVCTADSKYSMVLADVNNKNKSYVFSLSKGVDCFDYNKNLNAIVTGSGDHLVRIWNPYVTTRPVAVLHGHGMNILEVKIYEPLCHVFSYCRDSTVKVWDMKEHTCLQTITLKYPIGQMGRLPDYGSFPMHFHPNPKSLILTANDYIAMLKLGEVKTPVSLLQPMTHKTQLCAAIYNPHFKQVVTAADDSSVGIWDVETGAKSMMFTGAHSSEEITSLALDEAGRRLITGARNGTIKVWNVQNGHNLHQLEAVDESEVTGLIPVADKKMIIAVGWSRKIIQYADTEPDNVHIKANSGWKGGHLHKEDILSSAFCPPNVLATASFDGEILIWFLETEALFKKLRKTRPARTSAKISALLGNRRSVTGISLSSSGSRPPTRTPSRTPSRPNSRHRSAAGRRPIDGEAPPVDKLLFLLSRVESRMTEAAILVSSEAGILRWWSVFGKQLELGYFYAPEEPDECILGLCSNKDNSLLISGDTQGKITVWNIRNYCVEPTGQVGKMRPEMVISWTGHSHAVVSVECVNYESSTYLVSASADATAKLWSLDGLAIGTFGQKKLWTLGEPLSWIEPPEWAIKAEEERTLELLKSRNTESVPSKADENEDSSVFSDVEMSKEEQLKTTPIADETPTKNSHRPVEKVLSLPALKFDETQQHDRSKTFSFGSTIDIDTKVGLGSRALQRFARVRHDRQKRRENVSEIDFSRTNRYGTLQCCAYQAVNIPALVEIPDGMPLSPRMIWKRGVNGGVGRGGGGGGGGGAGEGDNSDNSCNRKAVVLRGPLPSIAASKTSTSSVQLTDRSSLSGQMAAGGRSTQRRPNHPTPGATRPDSVLRYSIPTAVGQQLKP